jgi:pyruvate kinase
LPWLRLAYSLHAISCFALHVRSLSSVGFKELLESALNDAIDKKPPDAVGFLRKYFDKVARSKSGTGMQAVSQDAKCALDHSSMLDIYSDPAAVRGTGIICTIGPKTKAPEKLTMLREAGLNIVRMNFSHGSYEYHGEVIAAARQSCQDARLSGGRLVAIALDTKGPEIRSGSLKEELGSTVDLVAGSTVLITTDDAEKDNCSAEMIYMDYKNLPKVMAVGQSIMVDDGLIELRVTSKDEAAGTMQAEVVNAGKLGGKKGCNLPEVDVDLPALSEKDKADLAFAVSQNVDMVFASFIRKASDVRDVRACLVAADPVIGKRIRIISKIENHEGMRNFDEILVETDGVMVARGDLGIEIPTQKVFLAQKMMIAKCNIAGKPVICATQMLESMTNNPRPTRAEASDVANAVLDGADCVMLSGETAKGSYPKEAVTVMAAVCKEAEAALFYKELVLDLEAVSSLPMDPSDSVAKAVVEAATCSEASLIITLTRTGTSARLISKHRPRCPIMVLASDVHVGAACNLHRSCRPFACPDELAGEGASDDDRFLYALQLALRTGLAKSGDTVVLAHGLKSGKSSLTNFRLSVLA